MSTVMDAMRARLLADTTVAALVGTRVYPVLLPQNAADKCVTITLINEPRNHTLDAKAVPNPYVQVDVWANEYSDCVAIADAISASLDGFRGTMGSLVSVSACLQVTRRQTYEPESQQFRVGIDFSIWHN